MPKKREEEEGQLEIVHNSFFFLIEAFFLTISNKNFKTNRNISYYKIWSLWNNLQSKKEVFVCVGVSFLLSERYERIFPASYKSFSVNIRINCKMLCQCFRLSLAKGPEHWIMCKTS